LSLVSPRQAAAFQRDGFLRLDGVSDARDLATVEELLDGLFERTATIAPEHVRDHGDPAEAAATARVPELNQTALLEPRLRRTRVYRTCRRIANELLATRCNWYFDHAIYKPPHGTAPTPWHQDHSYSHGGSGRSIQFWIPLQDVDESTGCMWFLPGRHLQEDLPHRKAHAHPEAHTLEVVGADTSVAQAVPLRLGDATVHTSRTLHTTGPNHGERTRKAWILGFGPIGLKGRLRPDRLLDAAGDWLAGS
jgi:ectoine hydroxylase-related dioxygenase (phytanoyl-CoA dioxygenase family)